MSEDRVLVEDFIDGAIITGYQRGSRAFLESLESQLETASVIEEAGDAHELLQFMLDESNSEATFESSTQHLQSLDEKLSRILR